MSEASGTRANRPLDGVTVIDFGQIYQGPYATFLMAKAGADVIKVEPPAGEPMRYRAKATKGAGLPMAMINSNKRGITLNLKTARGCELLKEMVTRADVLLENFTPGVMDRLGVGWEVLREINPRLIYASGTGFGLSGPDKDNMAMDLTVQASSGLMSVTGEPDGPPLKCGAAVVDFMSGIHLYAAVMTALYERTFTGKGRLVEVAMQEAVYCSLASNVGALYSADGKVPARTANRHGGLALVPYNVYRAKDGYVAIICVKEVHWQSLLAGMQDEDLGSDPRFKSNQDRVANMDECDACIEAWTSTLSKDEFREIARRHRIPSAPVRDMVEVVNDAHMHERGMLEWIDHPDFGRIVVPGSPLRIHETDPVTCSPSPALGQHNDEIYGAWLGLGSDGVAALQRDGVI
jgi:crotonobetainyl-CoA:carnitine CoA-transferase CaiB-like acyl-CoA transferase